MLNQVASSKTAREHPGSVISQVQTALSRSRRIYQAASSSEKLVLSFGLDPAWVLRRRTGGFQAAPSALSNEQRIAPYIGGALVYLPLHCG